jgi:flagellar hook assembly protein FlgD
VPSSYSLGQNYPNPFNPMCNVQFTMCNAGNVKIVVYDIQGREVQTLVNEKLNAGTYEVKFDGSGLTSGIYFYRMVVRNGGSSMGDFTETRRMLLIK